MIYVKQLNNMIQRTSQVYRTLADLGLYGRRWWRNENALRIQGSRKDLGAKQRRILWKHQVNNLKKLFTYLSHCDIIISESIEESRKWKNNLERIRCRRTICSSAKAIGKLLASSSTRRQNETTSGSWRFACLVRAPRKAFTQASRIPCRACSGTCAGKACSRGSPTAKETISWRPTKASNCSKHAAEENKIMRKSRLQKRLFML